MALDGATPVRGRLRTVAGGVMWFLSLLMLAAAVAIIRDPGLWVVLLDHGAGIALILILLSGLLLAAAGPVFGVRSVRARGAGYWSAAVVTLCATRAWFVAGQLAEHGERGGPAQLVAVSTDGRFELVSRDGSYYRRDVLWLRSRSGLFSRESLEALGCFRQHDLGGYDEPVDWAGFTGPGQVTVRLRDGRSGTADFDGPTLMVTGRQGGCAGPGPVPGR